MIDRDVTLTPLPEPVLYVDRTYEDVLVVDYFNGATGTYEAACHIGWRAHSYGFGRTIQEAYDDLACVLVLNGHAPAHMFVVRDAVNTCTVCGDTTLMAFEMARPGCCARCEATLPVPAAQPVMADLPVCVLRWWQAFWQMLADGAQDFDTLHEADRNARLIFDDLWVRQPALLDSEPLPAVDR